MADAIVGSVAVDVVPSAKTWNTKLRAQLLPQADKLGQDIGKRIGDNIRDRLRAELRDLPDAQVKLKADTSDADRKMTAVGVKADELGRKRETISVKANVRSAEADLDRLAAKLKAASGGPSKGLLLGSGIAALGPAVGGIAATAVPAIGGLVATLATAGAGAGAFALVAVPAFKKVQTAAQGLSKANLQLKQAQAAGTSPAVLRAQQNLTKAQAAQAKVATGSSKQQAAAAATVLTAQQRLAAAEKNSPVNKALLKQKQILDQLDPSQKAAVKDYQAFTGAVTDFQKSVEPQVYKTIGGGFKLIADQLPKIAPLTKGAAAGFLTLEKDADKALNAPFYKNFFTFLQKDAKNSIVDLGTAAGNTFTGIAGLVQAYDPEIAASRQGLVGLTSDFSKFGQNAASGKSAAFNQFRDFSHDIAPQVKADLRDIGGLLGTTLTGLAPSVSPSLKLLDDTAKGLGPVIKPIEEQLPGVIKNIDRLVVKVAPLAAEISAGFSSGAARAIKDFAGAIGSAASALGKLPDGVIRDAGGAIGFLVAASAIGKLTGLSKMAGYVAGLGAKSAIAAPEVAALATASSGLGTSAGGVKTAGREAEIASGKFSKLKGLARDLGGAGAALAGPWGLAALAIGETANQAQKVADKSGAFKTIEDTAKSQGGYWDIAKAGAKSYFDQITGQGKNGFFNIDANDKATPKIKAATATAKDYANLNIPPVDLKAKDNASAVIQKPLVSAKDYGALNLDPVKLKASDHASPVISQARLHAALFANLKPNPLLRATDKATPVANTAKQNLLHFALLKPNPILRVTDNASGPTHKAQGVINSLHGKTVTATANVNGLGAVAGLNAQINALHNKEIAITTRVQTIQLQTTKVSSGHAVARAAGGPLRAHQLSWVGERGKELIETEGPAHVYNHSQSMAMEKQMGDIKGYASGGTIPAGQKLITESAYKRGVAGTGVKHTAAEWRQIEAAKGPQYIQETTAATRAAAAKQRSNLQAAGEKVFSSILSGFSGSASVAKIASTATSVISKIDSAFTGSRRSSLVKFVQKENRDLQGLAKQRDALKVKLSTYSDARTSAVQAATSFGAVTTLPTGTGSGNLVAGLRIKLGDIKTFSRNLKTLAKRGLNARALNQIIAAGPDQGAAYAAELVAGTNANIKSVSSLTNQISLASRQFGTLAANSEVGGNIAKDFVAGIVSREGRLSDAMTRAARAFAKQLQLDFNRQASSIKAKTVKVKVTKHDTGGLLPEGLSVNLNETGRPEPVLTPSEEKAFRSIANSNATWSGKAAQHILPNPTINIYSDTDADALGQRLALIMRGVG